VEKEEEEEEEEDEGKIHDQNYAAGEAKQSSYGAYTYHFQETYSKINNSLHSTLDKNKYTTKI